MQSIYGSSQKMFDLLASRGCDTNLPPGVDESLPRMGTWIDFTYKGRKLSGIVGALPVGGLSGVYVYCDGGDAYSVAYVNGQFEVEGKIS